MAPPSIWFSTPSRQDTARPRIVQVAQAMHQRVLAGSRGELVHHALDRPDIHERAEPAQGARADRHLAQRQRHMLRGISAKGNDSRKHHRTHIYTPAFRSNRVMGMVPDKACEASFKWTP